MCDTQKGGEIMNVSGRNIKTVMFTDLTTYSVLIF